MADATRRWIVGLTLAATAGFASGWVLLREGPPASKPEPDAPSPPSSTRIDSEVADLRARLAKLERRRDPPGRALDPSPAEPQEVKPVPSPEERAMVRLERIERRFQDEPADPVHDGAEASRIASALKAAEDLSESHPVRIECRSRVCRLEVEHDSEAAFAAFRDRVSDVMGPGGTYVRVMEREPRFRSLAVHFRKDAG